MWNNNAETVANFNKIKSRKFTIASRKENNVMLNYVKLEKDKLYLFIIFNLICTNESLNNFNPFIMKYHPFEMLCIYLLRF